MTIMNHYERNLVEKLQCSMSKREAQDALMEIREGLYGDCYEMIRPLHFCDNHGKVHHDYPRIKDLIEAYYSDNFERFLVEEN